MANTVFTLNAFGKIKAPRKPLEDGQYAVTITKLVNTANSNPYLVLTTEDGRVKNFFINNEKTVEIMADCINKQLDRYDQEDMDTLDWFDSIIGTRVNIWLMTTTKDNQVYQNVYFYKPTGFDASVNGAL